MPKSLRQAQNRANETFDMANVCVLLARFLHQSVVDIYGSRLQPNAYNFKCLRINLDTLRPLLETEKLVSALLVDIASDFFWEGTFGHMCIPGMGTR